MRPGQQGFAKQIEEMAMFPAGDFSLEVSSPGLDEPLKMLRQYRKNIGRQVELTLQDGSKKEGKLLIVGTTASSSRRQRERDMPGNKAARRRKCDQSYFFI